MQNPSKTQKEKLLKLNLRLQNLQEKIIKEAVKLDIELSKRVADETDILDDYEIDLKIHFILREDNENYKEDDDNFVTEINEYLKGISIKRSIYPWDDSNHNEFNAWENHIMKDDYHCWLFHSLYDHSDLNWEDILNIGEIYSDIKVIYQYAD